MPAANRSEDAPLTPLVCGGCGAALVLEDRDVLTCPYCQATVPVPARHREALVAERDEARTRDEARRLYERLSRPMGAPLRLVAFVFGGVVERVAGSVQGNLRWLAIAWALL